MAHPTHWRGLGSRGMCALLLALCVGGGTPASAQQEQPVLKLNKIQRRLLSGFADQQLQGAAGRAAVARVQSGGGASEVRDTSGDGRRWPFYVPTEDDLCPQDRGSNVRVNQDCQNVSDADLAGPGQAQNEPQVALDPNDRNHLVASFNDYQPGDARCGGAFSVDGGQSWAATAVPATFTRGTTTIGNPPVTYGGAREYWTSSGDTSVAFDTRGSAYFSCQVFNRGSVASNNQDASSAMLVFRSSANHGASWDFPGRYVTAVNNVLGDPSVFEDKQLMTVDNHAGSPFQDRIYVSWTEFTTEGTAYIWLAYSADYGETFSQRHLVSTTSNALCTVVFGLPTSEGACNQNQFSQPFTGPDGTLYVLYDNFNVATAAEHGNDDTGSGSGNAPGPVLSGPSTTATPPAPIDNRNQILLTRSTDGGATFSSPVKVADYYDLPDCAASQAGKNAGRGCQRRAPPPAPFSEPPTTARVR